MTTTVSSGAGTPATHHPVQQTSLDVRGPYDLDEVAGLGFGPRDERQFDGVLRLACCLDPDYEAAVGVEVRQHGGLVELTVHSPGSDPLDSAALEAVARQVARAVSLDHDGAAFEAVCRRDPVLARLHAVAPGFRPALFNSAYEAAVWAVVSARRPRNQGIALWQRLCELHGTAFELAGRATHAAPAPSRLRAVESVPG